MKAVFLDVHVVVCKLRNEEAFGGARLEDEIGGSVIVNKLADVAAFLVEWAEALYVVILAVDAIAYGNHYASKFVAGVVEVSIQNEFVGARIDENFWALETQRRAKMLGVGESYDLAAKLPMDKVARGIAGHVAIGRIVGLGTVFAEPVIRYPSKK